MGERPGEDLGYEGFGLREIRQTVVVDFGHPDRFFLVPDLAGTEDFMIGDVLPMAGGDTVLRVVQTHRIERLAPDGAIERDWVLRIEAIG